MLKRIHTQKNYILTKLTALLLLDLMITWHYRDIPGSDHLMILLSASYILICTRIIHTRKPDKYRQLAGSYTIFLVFLLLWMILISILKLGDPILYPSPMRILEVMVKVFPKFLENLMYSLKLFGISFFLSLITAFPLGLLLGSFEHIRAAWEPYIKTLSLISPIAYTPYIVGIMPAFRAAQIFVVFTGTFWPILKWTIFGMSTLDKNYTLTARLLGMNQRNYYMKVVIPGIMPAVLTGINASISGGFTILVAAEIIGSRSGLGFFIKYFADFLNYHNVLAGIIYLGIAVCLVTWIYEKIQSYILSWQTNERRRHIGFYWKIR